MSESEGMKKFKAVLKIGIVVLVLVLVGKWAYGKYQEKRMTTAPNAAPGMLAQLSETFEPVIPTTAAAALASEDTACVSALPTKAQLEAEVFPGSYTNFAQFNTGCVGRACGN